MSSARSANVRRRARTTASATPGLAPAAGRLFDVKHASRIDQIDAALDALGRRLVISSVAR